MASRSGRRGIVSTILRRIATVFLLVFLGWLGLLAAYAVLPPVSTLMLARYVEHAPVERDYVALRRISPHLIAAVVMSEDARFCRHNGVDWASMREVMDEAGAEGPSRGASTIPMQTAKNLFLWPSRSYVRKGLEIPLALVIDRLWSKGRILEIYLNIAEWGDGIFGAEAAAHRYFNKRADALTPTEAALLAAVLPNPFLRHPDHPSRFTAAHARTILARAKDAAPWLDCLNPQGVIPKW